LDGEAATPLLCRGAAVPLPGCDAVPPTAARALPATAAGAEAEAADPPAPLAAADWSGVAEPPATAVAADVASGLAAAACGVWAAALEVVPGPLRREPQPPAAIRTAARPAAARLRRVVRILVVATVFSPCGDV
jgi:hypothetical protein